jgi:hypothetical protein
MALHMEDEQISPKALRDDEAQTVEKILNYHKRGARVLFADSHTGEIKIKIEHGPMGLMVKRYRVPRALGEKIKSDMAKGSKSSA